MIKVVEEDKWLIQDFGVYESCIFCNNKTKYWHEKSNNPICKRCAKIKKSSDIKNILK